MANTNWLEEAKGISKSVTNKYTVIMGKIGTSKTTSAGTYPKPMLYITVAKDGGGIVLKGYSDDEIKFLDITSDNPLDQAYVNGKNTPKSSYTKIFEILTELKENCPFKTVVIDTATAIQEDLVKFLEAYKGGKKLNEGEWGTVGKLMSSMVDLLAELSQKDTEYVSIMHIKEHKLSDSTTGQEYIEYVPKMTLNNGSTFLEKANNVMYSCRKTVLNKQGSPEVKFLMYIGSHPYIDTKLRLPNGEKLDKGLYIEDFTFDKFQKIIKENDFEPKVTVVEPENPFKNDEEEIETKKEESKDW